MPKTILDGADITANATSEAFTPDFGENVHSFQVTTRQANGTQVLAPVFIHVVDRRPAYFRTRWDIAVNQIHIDGTNHPGQTDMWTTLGSSAAIVVGAATLIYVYAV